MAAMARKLIQLDDEINKALTERSEKTGASQSWIIRQALKQYLGIKQGEEKDLTK